jgi:osmoprotectant transport system substrate-binding protein
MLRKQKFVMWAALVVLGLVLVACGGGEPDSAGGGEETSGEAAATDTPIEVGSKDFVEQFILGNMYALVLEDAGFTVNRNLNLGGTDVAQAALMSEEIDLYPEYTGTALLTVLEMPPSSDQEEVYTTVADAYAEQFNLVWLEPAPMNNTQALAMTRERSEELGITTISDLAEQAENLSMVGPAEFREREDGLPGIQEAYGNFELQEYIPVDPGLRYRALVDGEADVAVAFGTDGEIAANDLVLLEDDRNLFPPYQVAPVVRAPVVENNPEIADRLNALSELLTTDVMQQLNNEVTGNEREPDDVARDFLVEQGLIDGTE